MMCAGAWCWERPLRFSVVFTFTISICGQTGNIAKAFELQISSTILCCYSCCWQVVKLWMSRESPRYHKTAWIFPWLVQISQRETLHSLCFVVGVLWHCPSCLKDLQTAYSHTGSFLVQLQNLQVDERCIPRPILVHLL